MNIAQPQGGARMAFIGSGWSRSDREGSAYGRSDSESRDFLTLTVSSELVRTVTHLAAQAGDSLQPFRVRPVDVLATRDASIEGGLSFRARSLPPPRGGKRRQR